MQTFTSPLDSTLVAAVWQLDDWCAGKLADGTTSRAAVDRLSERTHMIVCHVLAGLDRTVVWQLVDDLAVYVADPLNDLKFADDEAAWWTGQLAALADELTV